MGSSTSVIGAWTVFFEIPKCNRYKFEKSVKHRQKILPNEKKTEKRNSYLNGIGGDLDTMQTMDRRIPHHADVLAQRVGTIDFGGDGVGGGPATAAAAAAAAGGGGGGAFAFLVFFSGFLFGLGFGFGGGDEPRKRLNFISQ